MKKFLKVIGSLRITITVVLLIAGFSVYGTLIKQEEAMSAVYHSPQFIGLLILFGANLVACTMLRLRFRLTQTGFLATHLGVLVILAGGIAGFTGGESGGRNLAEGETASEFYARAQADPKEILEKLRVALEGTGGRIVEADQETATAEIPMKQFRAVMQALGESLVFERRGMEEDIITVDFILGIKIVEKPLPFTIRLDKFSVDYYTGDSHNYGSLVVADQEDRIIGSIPVERGRGGVVKGYAITVGEFLPNFVIDAGTRKARTRNRIPDNPAIRVSIVQGPGAKTAQEESFWVFANHHGVYEHMRRGREPLPFQLFFDSRERVKSYVSEVTILDKNGAEVRKASIKVNKPLTYRGYTIYQSSYDKEARRWTGLQVVTDPGLWVVYAGFALLLAGVAFIFYVKPYLRRRGKEPIGKSQ